MGLQARRHQARLAWAPSPLRQLLRHRLVQAVAIVAFGVAASLTWSARVGALDDARARLGERATVLVVTHRVEAGEPLAASVEVREIPLAFVPSDSLQEVGPEARATTALYPDEVLLAGRVTDDDAPGRPAGTVALTLSTVATAPLIGPGDLIDVWAVDAANISSRRITRRVLVLVVDSDEITIAVPADQVADTTAAALRPVVITLVG